MSSEKEKGMEERGATAASLRKQYGHRVIFKAMGFTSEELRLPRIMIVNSWSEQSPGHSHLRAISDGIKAGVRMAGGHVLSYPQSRKTNGPLLRLLW